MSNDPNRSHDGLEVLTEQQCRELLASRDLGRIVFSIGDQPEALPVNYATDGSIVVFRTGEGQKAQQVARIPIVTRNAWSRRRVIAHAQT